MNLSYVLFYVDDVKKSVEFYERAFGLKTAFIHESGQYAEMATGNTKLGFVDHETARSHQFDYVPSHLKSKPGAFEIAFTTKDVQQAFDLAVREGATPLAKPETKPWGQTVAYVRDCNGNLVEICTAM